MKEMWIYLERFNSQHIANKQTKNTVEGERYREGARVQTTSTINDPMSNAFSCTSVSQSFYLSIELCAFSLRFYDIMSGSLRLFTSLNHSRIYIYIFKPMQNHLGRARKENL